MWQNPNAVIIGLVMFAENRILMLVYSVADIGVFKMCGKENQNKL